MTYNLAAAAAATETDESTILKSIEGGKISATKDELGEWRIEPVERDPRVVTLVSVMRFAPRKRPLALLRALAEVRARFAVLDNRWDTAAGYLSGGEAQQLALGRALMSGPRLVLLDEPTLGLAPALVDTVFDLLVELRDAGVTVLVVEQNARRALEIADRGYVLRTGRLAVEGPGRQLAAHEDLFGHFVGDRSR